MNFRILGPLEVDGPLGQVRLEGRRRRLLLVRMLVSPNSVLTDDQLAEEIWAGRPPDGVASTLASHVSLVRQLIGKDRIRRKSGGYLLAVDPAEIDSASFAAEVDAGRTLWASGDRPAARDLLTGALTRWRGQALADAGDSIWAIGPRTRWEELRRAAEEDLADVRLELGEHRSLISMLEDAVTEEPLRERRWAQLMLAMYRSGTQADALHAYRRLWTLLDEDLGLRPSVELAQLEQSILRQDAGLDWSATAPVDRSPPSVGDRHRGPGPTRPGRQPSRRTRTIGREHELDHLLASLRDRQLITLTGVGGIGKSRLALEATTWAEQSFSEGACWVELSTLTGSDEVAGAVAGALGVRATDAAATVDAIADWMADRRELLVLDNCEHVLSGVVPLVDVLSSRCLDITVLATSRIPLGLAGEITWPVRALPPDDSFTLFEDRLFEIDPSLALSAGDRDRIHRICERVEGHPLAIEIAAAQARSRSIEDILELLPGGWGDADPGTVPPRHRSLDENVAWSLRLLDDDSRRLFEDLSVFPSGFDPNAAVDVCGAPDAGRRISFELAVLVGHSMIQVDRSSTVTRYRMLEAMRDVGRRSERARTRTRPLRTRHCMHYGRRSVNAGRATVGPGYHGNGSDVLSEWDNFRGALDWAVGEGDLDSAIDILCPIGPWAIRALQSEHRIWLERCLDLAAGHGEPRPSLLALAAKWYGFSGDHVGARRLAHEAIAGAGAGPDLAATAMSWVTVAYSSGMLGMFADASRAVGEAEAALDACGDGFTFVEGHAVLHPLIAIGSPGRVADHRDMVHRAALELDNVIANAIANRMDVVEHIRAGMIDKAAWLLPAAIESASRAQVKSIEMDLECMALGLVSPDDAGAGARYLTILSTLKSVDYGETIWGVLELLGTFWARRGLTGCAATVLGHLRAHDRRFPNPVLQQLRVRYLDPLASLAEVADRLESGAAMTRSELLNFALDRLESD